jgi:hypothetical protein
MKRQEVLAQVARVVEALNWHVYCSHSPSGLHWTDRVGPHRRFSPMLTVEDVEEATDAVL